jgi:hypothetical protein
MLYDALFQWPSHFPFSDINKGSLRGYANCYGVVKLL